MERETKYFGYTSILFLIAIGFRYSFKGNYLLSLLFFAPFLEELMKFMVYKLTNYSSLLLSKELGGYKLVIIGIIGSLFGFYEALTSYQNALLVKQIVRMIAHFSFPFTGYALTKYGKNLKRMYIYWVSGAVLSHIVFNWMNNFHIQTGYVISLLIISSTIISSK